MNKQTHPIRLTLLVLLLALVQGCLQIVGMRLFSSTVNLSYWMLFSTTSQLVTQTILLGIAVWLGFRVGRTNASTWYIPILLFSIATATGIQIVVVVWQYCSLYSIEWPSGVFIAMLHQGVWIPVQTGTFQYLACYLLSRGFGVFLQPVNQPDTNSINASTRRLSIRFLMICVFVVALLLAIGGAIDRAGVSESMPGSESLKFFIRVWTLLSSSVEPIGMFGVAVWISSREHRLRGIVAITVWFLAQVASTLVIMLYYLPTIQKDLPAIPISQFSIWFYVAVGGGRLLFNVLTVGFLYWHGYRFVVASRNPVPALNLDTPFDSIDNDE